MIPPMIMSKLYLNVPSYWSASKTLTMSLVDEIA